ncbi:Protein CBG27442 [Caenorhabditis briggsae]|nr:Protein CBG27442 [Caenorhabditis briggsae]CAS00249.1 Protein CBG27442 [Caenorhabditis briggsae]
MGRKSRAKMNRNQKTKPPEPTVVEEMPQEVEESTSKQIELKKDVDIKNTTFDSIEGVLRWVDSHHRAGQEKLVEEGGKALEEHIIMKCRTELNRKYQAVFDTITALGNDPASGKYSELDDMKIVREELKSMGMADESENKATSSSAAKAPKKTANPTTKNNGVIQKDIYAWMDEKLRVPPDTPLVTQFEDVSFGQKEIRINNKTYSVGVSRIWNDGRTPGYVRRINRYNGLTYDLDQFGVPKPRTAKYPGEITIGTGDGTGGSLFYGVRYDYKNCWLEEKESLREKVESRHESILRHKKVCKTCREKKQADDSEDEVELSHDEQVDENTKNCRKFAEDFKYLEREIMIFQCMICRAENMKPPFKMYLEITIITEDSEVDEIFRFEYNTSVDRVFQYLVYTLFQFPDPTTFYIKRLGLNNSNLQMFFPPECKLVYKELIVVGNLFDAFLALNPITDDSPLAPIRYLEHHGVDWFDDSFNRHPQARLANALVISNYESCAFLPPRYFPRNKKIVVEFLDGTVDIERFKTYVGFMRSDSMPKGSKHIFNMKKQSIVLRVLREIKKMEFPKCYLTENGVASFKMDDSKRLLVYYVATKYPGMIDYQLVYEVDECAWV